jgi:DNA-binding transcriptional MerR regulator
LAKDKPPRKLFRIGEVSRLTGVNPHVLRYWEAEFQILAPNRRLSTQRLYRQADIDLIRTIKRLLEDEKYTLSGVQLFLAARPAAPPHPPSPAPAGPQEVLQWVQGELAALRALLGDKD